MTARMKKQLQKKVDHDLVLFTEEGRKHTLVTDIQDLFQQIEEETAKGEEKMKKIKTLAAQHQQRLEEIDNINGERSQLSSCYNNFEASTGILRQFYPHLLVQSQVPPSFFVSGGSYRLFRDDEYPSLQTL